VEVQQFFKRPKFFIFGYPRSGKTLLARLMRLHPEVHCNGHARFFHERRDLVQHLDLPALQTWLERTSNHWTHGQSLTSPLVRVLCDFVMERDAALAGKPIVGDETPNHNNGAAVRRLHRIYPEARLLWVVRDGRDAVLFRRIQMYIDKPHLLSAAEQVTRDEFRKDKTAFVEAKRSIFTEAWLEQFTLAWAANVRETDAAARELFGDQYLGLRYEDLLQDPVGVMAQAWDFLGASESPDTLPELVQAQVADNSDADWHAQKDPDLVRDLDSAEIGAWRRIFNPADLKLFEDLAGAELQAWNYPLAGS
jgi:LPS sulfotransferase NodH